MKCNTPIDPETKMALSGESLEAALKVPTSLRCGYELDVGDMFCPSCGARVEISRPQTSAWYSFSGRATRKEYWKVTLLFLGCVLGCCIACELLNLSPSSAATFGVYIGIVFAFVSAPITVRRLHDLGFGWGVLVFNIVVSIFGDSVKTGTDDICRLLWLCALTCNIYWAAVICFKRGTKGPNKYGLDPRAGADVSVESNEENAKEGEMPGRAIGGSDSPCGVQELAAEDTVSSSTAADAEQTLKSRSRSIPRRDSIAWSVVVVVVCGVVSFMLRYHGEREKQRVNRIFEFNRRLDSDVYKDLQSIAAEEKFRRGLRFYNGDGVTQDKKEALRLWREAAEDGDLMSYNNIGACYEDGDGVESDPVEAAKWYLKAAEKGLAIAQKNLGVCYYNGTGVKQDKEEAVKWLRKAAEQRNSPLTPRSIPTLFAPEGTAEAQYILGLCYRDGDGVEENAAEAVEWFRRAAYLKHADAQLQLGVSYDLGKGVEQDSEEAVKWYRKAAEQGDAAAQDRLGYHYTTGNGVAKDDKEAVKWYRKAAEQGHAPAQNSLGYCYAIGSGVAKDDKEAARWFRKSAEQGNVHAQNSLGFSYLKGNGVEKNAVEAVKWFRKAAERGYAKAQCQLGFCYARGEGVTRDTDESLKWFRKAAEQGDGPACYEMGEVYRKGVGTKKDMNKAVEWYRKGVALGHSGCIMSLGFRYFYGESDLTPNNPKIALELFQKSIKIDDRPWAYYGAGLVYFHGIDGKPDYEKAVEMLKKASDRGVVCANYNLGVCYENGNGVEKDINKAKALYEKAAKGFDPAKKALERINRAKQ